MKSKNIAVFGCSWSQGISEDNFNNWVNHLSKKYSHHKFYNFGTGGSSIVYHTHLLEQATKIKKFDTVIFQITSPGRFTWWKPHNIIRMLTQQRENLWAIDNSHGKYVDRINIGTIQSKKFFDSDRKKHKFGIEYYSRLTDEQMLLDHKAYVNYIKDKVDLYFYHRSALNTGEHSVYDTLGKVNFDKFTIDEGDHFGLDGIEWKSDWVESLLNNKGLL